MIARKTFPIIASSSVLAGAINKTANGSSFEIAFEDPVHVPANALSCYVSVHEATVWWTVPNVSAAIGNNRLYVQEGGNNHVLVIPDGLYSVQGLSDAIERELVEASGIAGLLALTSDEATQHVNVDYAVALMQLDFTQPDTPRTILGFDSRLVPLALTAGEQHELGDNVAAFNSLDHFLIHGDLVRRGIRTDGTFNRTIAKVSIDKHPGSQIIYSPYNPLRMEARNLIGASMDRMTFWLTDQNNVPADTHGEDWTVTVVIAYDVKLSV